jgi:CheY-like chemotaxis protein/HPt (histidine-containing phosphotransfer) domain-containing protein
MVLRDMTSSWGLEPTEAEDENQALDKIVQAFSSGRPYQILLLDSQLSEVEGFDIANSIKDSPYGKDLKIILLTSMAKRGDAAQCTKCGISAYLVKPVKKSDLLDAIMMALGYPADKNLPVITRYMIEGARRRLRILVVEDNKVNQKVVTAILKKRGHAVTLASTGHEALSTLERERFDVVLMDVQMPEMDGFEATGLIREKEKVDGEHVPIIAMTAHAMQGDREKCLAAGMDDYISKPIRPEDLLSVIDKTLNALTKNKDSGRGDSKEVEVPAEDVFDVSEAMKAVSGDKGLFEEIAALFAQSAADNMGKIRQGIAARNAIAVEEAAHCLKGSVANFGAKRAFEAAKRLEFIGKGGNLAEAESARTQLEMELKALEMAMQATIRGQ